ncbi:hypothetical protein GCM10010218_17760 [Streptomyces mashuensis]|uniref:Uncharacterized protein n=1 Tax=Streptomyces mashuensis TaxID=33904 RepID=A0A919EC06_9ACTN|nr:hypothetical protein [Streptomyces mashuensis]GHF36669.1 hypothetical protein GCM10010218_17760 [Streptomyces mashuensis]
MERDGREGRDGPAADGARPDRPEASTTVEAQALLPMIWADPQHMPEQLAFFAVRRFGPRAAAAVARRKQREPSADDGALVRATVTHGTRLTIVDGAALGGPFVVLMPVSFVAALLSQAQMVLEVAALAGRDPCDEARVADLLVLQNVHPSPEAAARALTHVERHPHGGHGKVPRRTRWSLLVRMAAILGLVGGGERQSRAQQVLSWTWIGALFLVGMVLPLIWVPALAAIYRKNTLRLAAKAVAYYTPGRAGDLVRHRHRPVHLPTTAGLATVLRLVVLMLTPFLATVAVVWADVRLAGGFWGTCLLVLVAVSLLVAGAWSARRRSRRG